MPCTAKKWEISRNDDMKSAGHGNDVDISITTRELARMIKQAGIELLELADEEADNPMGPYTGAGTIFGATGGVMEAAVRSAHFLVTKRELGDVNFMPVRGLEGVKEAEVDMDGTTIKIAVAHQMGNIAAVLDRIRSAKAAGQPSPWQFVEVMACRGGCVGGGGQSYGCTDEVRAKRAACCTPTTCRASTAVRTRTPLSPGYTRSSWASLTATRPTNCCTPAIKPGICI